MRKTEIVFSRGEIICPHDNVCIREYLVFANEYRASIRIETITTTFAFGIGENLEYLMYLWNIFLLNGYWSRLSDSSSRCDLRSSRNHFYWNIRCA
jgi:hypothetical protein